MHLRDILIEEILSTGQILDARAYIEGLPTTIFLTQQRLTNRDWIEGRNESAHRQAIDWRRGNDRKVASPVSASCKVRGIGVAVSVSTCTSDRSALSFSLWATPKCCSSSTTSNARSRNFISLPSSAWVPITMSTLPSARPDLTLLSTAGGTSRDAWATFTGNPRNRSEK